MGIVVWLIAAALLAALELAAGEFTFLMLGAAALAGAGITAAGGPLWLQVAAFGVTALGLIVFLRPYLKRKLTQPPAIETGTQALVGKLATVEEEAGSSAGLIRLDGELWSARTVDPDIAYEPGSRVRVLRFEGPTAIVWKET
ncbi:NfeD family protein [Corynebacterium otitidis]|uniref:Putative secreted protein n=1 Tax=Corynebacterium otitidis ATCC 51513 TaxID=883169 RepID=I7LBD8_9CORY|nr:NfeD family protein [Corynebacterium otitidis]EJZ82833.1 hypothetical protein HMPREF9719_00235 [Corynebacterium otitidis ATCC 51513]CCI83029.1 putative secreted protein [Corynebacterium otitidis ATCC 51513]